MSRFLHGRHGVILLLCVLCAWTARAMAAPRWNVRESPHFMFYYQPDKVMDAEVVQQSAESAYQRITDYLGYAPAGRIPVYMYSDRKDFQKDAGFRRTELVVGTASSADQAIRLDASKLLESPDRVIGHEVVHIFLFQMLGPRAEQMPLWLHEGLAQEAGGADAREAEQRVVQARLDGRLDPLGTLTKDFPDGEKAGLAYDQAHMAVNGLLARGGWPQMRALLERLRLGDTFNAGMEATYGFGANAWERRWQGILQAEARSRFWYQVAEWLIPGMMFAALLWGTLTVRAHRKRQVQDEEPVQELEPPAWWPKDDWR